MNRLKGIVMKKISLIFALIMLIQVCFTACSAQSDDTGKVREPFGLEDPLYKEKHALYGDWCRYIMILEDTYGALLWANDYVEVFFNDPTWDNLVIASCVVTNFSGNVVLIQICCESIVIRCDKGSA